MAISGLVLEMPLDGDLSFLVGDATVTTNGGEPTYIDGHKNKGLKTEVGKVVEVSKALGSSFTLCFWGRIDSFSDPVNTLIASGWVSGETDRVGLTFGSSFNGSLAYINAGSDETWRNTGIDFSSTNFIAISYDGAMLRVYDGVTDSPVLFYESSLNIKGGISLGNFSSAVSNDYGANGLIDQIEVYNRPLTGSEIIEVRNPPLTYQETILETEGLLAYYPLYVDGKDVSDLGSDMSNAGSGTPIFTPYILSPEGFGSFHSSKFDSGDAHNRPSFLSLPTPSLLQCIEAYVQFDIEPDTYCGLMGFNLANTSPDDNDYRVMLSYDAIHEKLRLRVGLDTYESDYQASLFSTPKHVVMQYELEQDATIVYVDGVEVARVSGGGFNTLTTNSMLLAGAFTYTSPTTWEVGFYGNTQTSDCALYNRPLTRTEIWQRAFFKPIDPNSPDPFGDGSLISKYRLDGDATDLTGNYHGTATNVTYDEGKFGYCAESSENSVINLNGHPTFNTTQPFSLSLFVLTHDLDTEQRFFAFNLYNYSYVGLRFIGGAISAGVCNTNIISEVTISADTFYHVVLTYDGTQANLYVDTVHAGSASGAHSNVTNGINFNVLANRGGTTSLTGKLDQLELYNRALTESEIYRLYKQSYGSDPIANLLLSLSSITWSNRETKAQANPQPIYLEHHGIMPFHSTYAVKNNIFHNDVVLDQQGKQREFGFIASTVEVSGIPVANKRVLLFTNDTGLIIDETVSDSAGNYRFDSLLLGKKYMITAQYGNADENTPPDYSATSVDWQSPTPYTDGV